MTDYKDDLDRINWNDAAIYHEGIVKRCTAALPSNSGGSSALDIAIDIHTKIAQFCRAQHKVQP